MRFTLGFMHPIAIIIIFFAILAAFIAGTVFAQRKSVRVVAAIAAFGWACFMFMAASWAESLNYNIWYSSAASKMLEASIISIEQGQQDAVLREMRRMTNELDVTYERRGNFKELAERMAESLTTLKPSQGAAANRRPAGQLDGSDNLAATVASDRAFPAAVAELGR